LDVDVGDVTGGDVDGRAGAGVVEGVGVEVMAS